MSDVKLLRVGLMVERVRPYVTKAETEGGEGGTGRRAIVKLCVSHF